MKTLMKNAALTVLFGLVLLVAACANQPADEETSTEEETMGEEMTEETMEPRMAVATLSPTEGNDVSGTVTFTETDGAVRVEASVNGLSEGMHGFHIHETGDCSAPDASSAGGHFNPNNTPHGAPDAPADQRHVGDLGNLEAGADGSATYSRTDSLLAFDSTNNIVGKAVIVHGGADDLTSQPSGAAGPRVACGVIELQGGEM
jgi:Cu-Zn family superoxide dismutase